MLNSYTPDDGWINGREWKILLTTDERASLFEWVRTDLVPRLETGEGWGDAERDSDDDPVESALRGYSRAFEHAGDFEAAQAFDDAVDAYSSLPNSEREYNESWGTSPLTGSRLATPPSTGRSMFDDIDAE